MRIELRMLVRQLQPVVLVRLSSCQLSVSLPHSLHQLLLSAVEPSLRLSLSLSVTRQIRSSLRQHQQRAESGPCVH